jgi:predicted RNA binding protein YcfA (HicA-like mRNA interferase family)
MEEAVDDPWQHVALERDSAPNVVFAPFMVAPRLFVPLRAAPPAFVGLGRGNRDASGGKHPDGGQSQCNSAHLQSPVADTALASLTIRNRIVVISPQREHFFAVDGRILTIGHNCPRLSKMKPPELLRRLRRFAAKNGFDLEVSEGKNHTKVTLAGRRSVVGRHAADLKTGTLQGILKQLGLTPEDIKE